MLGCAIFCKHPIKVWPLLSDLQSYLTVAGKQPTVNTALRSSNVVRALDSINELIVDIF